MDGLRQNRIVQVRLEIASIQQENELYRSKGHRRSSAEFVSHDLRKLRLLAIQEELLKMSSRSLRIQ